MASLPEASRSSNNELRSISETLLRISRLLHEHTHKLEVAVEGTYASQSGDARVRLLSDSLNVNRQADLELGRLSYALQRVQQELLGRVSGRTLVHQTFEVPQTFEKEREELTTNITNLQQQRDELETLYDIAHVLNSTLEFDKVLSLVMDRVIEFVQAERGFLVLVNPTTRVPEFTIARDQHAQTLPAQAASAQISWGTVRRVIATCKPELADDAQQDDTLRAQESIMAFGIRSIMCAPLIVRNNCIGAVYVDSRIDAHLFALKHLDLLLAFCNQAAIAIDNARLFANLNRAIQQVQEDKQYMENVLGSIANGVVTTDSEGTITTFNAATQTILDIRASSAIGRNYREVFQALPAQVGLIPLLQSASLQHDQGTIVNRAIECELPRRGLVSLNVYVSALRDTRNAYIGVALVIDDRTDLKRTEARVKEIRGIFERYVHPNVVQQLIQNPMALELGGETKEISVLFADIRGYTSLSEQRAPQEMMDLINRYLKIMCEAIWEEEGTLTAFQGDALMAIFNAPLPQQMHALHAVRAAWKMRMAVLQYRQEHPQEMQINFGFGVNTGLATVGNLGSRNRIQNYTAIGDVVNVASRLQNNVTDNSILINDTTYMQVYPYVKTGQLFKLEVKNKSAPLTVRYLLGI